MSRKLFAALVIGTLGAGISTQAMAGDWNNKAGWSSKSGGDRDGLGDWRHRGWEQGNHNGWRDRNHDGRVDWRDRPGARDRNHDGRVDWRDRPGVRDYNHDGRVDWRDRRILGRNDRNHDGVLDWRDRRSWW